ncbi:hypothetical protein CA264_07745 [Pontibacter actiniarum]|uniref:Uncharacterized protein n=1 Tax=Pontibacter actiniarum TaxID=323450 RepID=A0A1X9YR53_9BACT|nr:hypothetical protein CA264_07745 [Pontibacter actiniarum]
MAPDFSISFMLQVDYLMEQLKKHLFHRCISARFSCAYGIHLAGILLLAGEIINVRCWLHDQRFTTEPQREYCTAVKFTGWQKY